MSDHMDNGIQSNNKKGIVMPSAWAFVVSGFTFALIYVLNTSFGSLPAIGKVVDPTNGCWQNAEAINKKLNNSYVFPALNNETKVWFDERMVPHIHATNEHDLYFMQGYIHAYFRLWQMDMQTRAAAGRVSEVVGETALDFDRKQRRKGMGFAAENSLRAMEANVTTKQMLDAYTAGVNQFIEELHYKDYPLEYKLMSFRPEPWTNLKVALLLKYMADDLTGQTDDIAHSYLKAILPEGDFELLYPDKIVGSTPVIPPGTKFDTPSLPYPTAPSDSLAFPAYKTSDFGMERERGKGSNNWALSGNRTASGAAILCNDPHLALNLPSLWYEVQLQAPGLNVYGASLPGAPGVVIGFNDSMSWGITNNYRDVKDYYEIKPVDGSGNKYWLSGKQLAFKKRIEQIGIKGQHDFTDTVLYTIHGPVTYDLDYNEQRGLRRMLAVSWTGHRASNEQLAIYLLNKSKNYNDFTNAIQYFECPAQNMIYADRKGNIALWGQGQFINKWKNQGRFVMNGSDSATLWQELIPMSENPHAVNPDQGYLASANQCVTDSTYPYWYNGDYTEFRAWRINEVLSKTNNATIADMFALQNDNFSVLARNVLPIMLSYCTQISNPRLDTLRKWDYVLAANSTAATIFQLWWRNLYSDIWKDEFSRVPDYIIPTQERTMQLVMTDTALKYYDYRRTKKKEHLRDIVLMSYRETMDSLDVQEKGIGMQWYHAKNTSVTHLTKIPAFSFTNLRTGGWGNTVNAMKPHHGPSWRMVVQMGKKIEAYGIYPGGQSGNPGSKYYDNHIAQWEAGKYYSLLFMPNTDKQNDKIKFTWNASKE